MSRSVSHAPMLRYQQTMLEAFPDVDPGIQPFGSRVLVQIRSPKSMTQGGVIIVEDTKDTEKWNCQVARVLALGPVAYKDRRTLEPWPEGQWVYPGMFVRVPKFGGDRWEIPYGPKEVGDVAMFGLFNDLDIGGKITCDPRDVISFV
jgi:co-chaperonin GroES (HSP10)